MKLTITGGLLEHIRDALGDVVEGNAPALVGLDLAKATLEIEERDFAAAILSGRADLPPDITITSKDRQDVAVPAATQQALDQVIEALRRAGLPAPAATVGTRAQQLLAARGNVIGASTRRPPAPKATKGWRLDANGNVTRN